MGGMGNQEVEKRSYILDDEDLKEEEKGSRHSKARGGREVFVW